MGTADARSAQCDGCGRCVRTCAARIPIPEVLALYDELRKRPDRYEMLRADYRRATAGRGRASDCMHCGTCALRCPQRVDVPGRLARAAEFFER